MSQRPSGIICTPDELVFSLANPTVLYCLTRGDSLGLMVSHSSLLPRRLFQILGLQIATLACFLSLIALCYVFAVILVCSPSIDTRRWFKTSFHVQRNIYLIYFNSGKQKKGLKLFHHPMDLLIVRWLPAKGIVIIRWPLEAFTVCCRHFTSNWGGRKCQVDT